MRFKWPVGLEPGADGVNIEEDCEWDFSYYEGAPLLPAVGETVVFDDYSQPDAMRDGMTFTVSGRRFLLGIVSRRSEYDFTSTSYPGRRTSDSAVTLDLEAVQEWKP